MDLPFKTKQLSESGFIENLASATPASLSIILSSYANHQIPAWTCGKRCIPDHILWFVDKGEIQGEIRGNPIVVRPGMFHWISSGTPHYLKLTSKPPFSVFALRFQLKRKSSFLRFNEDRLAIESAPNLRRTMDSIHSTLKLRSPQWFLKFRSLLLLLTMEALEEQKSKNTISRSEFSMHELQMMTQFLQQNAHRKVTPRDLADFFHLSLDYFTRKFRRHFKIPPRQWLQDEQMRHVCSLLCETTSSIKEVADTLGYNDQRFFSRQFKKVMGMTPSEYRMRH
jgi:AraC family transcriptional regulator, arabinose operon regulatory protein